MRNIETAVDETLKQGAVASGALYYTISPVHTLKKFVETAKALLKAVEAGYGYCSSSV